MLQAVNGAAIPDGGVRRPNPLCSLRFLLFETETALPIRNAQVLS
jgi:hypothetical protein